MSNQYAMMLAGLRGFGAIRTAKDGSMGSDQAAGINNTTLKLALDAMSLDELIAADERARNTPDRVDPVTGLSARFILTPAIEQRQKLAALMDGVLTQAVGRRPKPTVSDETDADTGFKFKDLITEFHRRGLKETSSQPTIIGTSELLTNSGGGTAGGVPMWVWLAGGAALVGVVLLARSQRA